MSYDPRNNSSEGDVMLIYVGKGAFLPNIPARDLSDEEVEHYGGEKALVASGLYEPVSAPVPSKKLIPSARTNDDEED